MLDLFSYRYSQTAPQGAESLFLQIFHGHNLCSGAEFFVVAKTLLHIYVEVLKQREPHIDLAVNWRGNQTS